MTKVPKTVADECRDALNALLAESDRFRDWNSSEIQSIVQAVERLKEADAREAYIRLGCIATICGNVDGLLESYGKALLLQEAQDTKHEFWVSLANAGLYRKAQEVGSWLLDPRRGFFPKIWQLASSRGQVLEVWGRLSDAMKTYPELSGVDFSALKGVALLMEARGLTDQDVISVLDLMGEIQRAHRVMFYGDFVSIPKEMRPPDDPPYLYFTIPLSVSVDELHAMNRELAKHVVERLPEGAFPQGMVAAFAKAEPLALRAAA